MNGSEICVWAVLINLLHPKPTGQAIPTKHTYEYLKPSGWRVRTYRQHSSGRGGKCGLLYKAHESVPATTPTAAPSRSTIPTFFSVTRAAIIEVAHAGQQKADLRGSPTEGLPTTAVVHLLFTFFISSLRFIHRAWDFSLSCNALVSETHRASWSRGLTGSYATPLLYYTSCTMVS